MQYRCKKRVEKKPVVARKKKLEERDVVSSLVSRSISHREIRRIPQSPLYKKSLIPPCKGLIRPFGERGESSLVESTVPPLKTKREKKNKKKRGRERCGKREAARERGRRGCYLMRMVFNGKRGENLPRSSTNPPAALHLPLLTIIISLSALSVSRERFRFRDN